MAINSNLLKLIIADQREEAIFPEDYFERKNNEEKLTRLSLNKETIVLTGLRRSGKSVLLQRMRRSAAEKDYYLNFEDERLITFSVEDFQVLQKIFVELFGVQQTFYFDEIQNIIGWEQFVRRLYNNGNKIYITGSNANLFSEELGTRLTGRYIAIKIYPFSFAEFVAHQDPSFTNNKIISTTGHGQIKKIFNEYVELGGIPEYVKHSQIEYLQSLYESILYRDIIARYKLPSEKAIRELVFYLASNCSKEITYGSLRKLLQLGSTTTISDYCTYLENSFLCFFVNRYHESVKLQMQAPKKVYFVDHVLAKIIGFRFSEDYGRMLENMVFIELKRRDYEVFYYHGSKECDFVVRKNAKIVTLIQVCQSLQEIKTREREFSGLLEALHYFSLEAGYILTEDEESIERVKYHDQEYEIKILPLWKWLLGTT